MHWYGYALLVGLLMVAYYFVDAKWLHPEQYSSATNAEDTVWESRDEGDIYSP